MTEKELLPKELLEDFVAQGDTDDQKDPAVLAKYFYPDFSWTWYAIEYEPSDRTFFGFVVGNENEMGYFSLDELLGNRGKLGCSVERDLYFKPCQLSVIKGRLDVRSGFSALVPVPVIKDKFD
jgi:hypothetical protein